MSFAENFWTQDYHSGFETLFFQLNEGIRENDDFVNLFRKRMESELLYGTSLHNIALEIKPTSKRQTNDDFVSTIKNAYSELIENFTKESRFHLEIAENIENSVLKPFEKWCGEHEQRIAYSQTTVSDEYKKLKYSQNQVEKLQKRYFNKCRMLEEFRNHHSEQELQEELSDLEFQKRISQQQKNGLEEEGEDGVDDDNGGTGKGSSGGAEFSHAKLNSKQTEEMLRQMLTGITQFAHKVPILGTYQNVSTGSAITQWALDNIPELNNNLERAECFGQDLIKNEFLKIIGTMGKSFINSSQFCYQWKPKAFEIAKLAPDYQTDSTATFGKGLGQFNFDDVKEAIGVSSVDYTDKSQYPKLLNEVSSLDAQYYTKVVELDIKRCKFEELVMDHLTFMQKCELDRLKAIKKATFDFIGNFHSRINIMQDISGELQLLEETINPKNDLKFLIENYATGNFKPQVTLYDNYYDSNIRQTFGVDLNVKSRIDKKVVPILIQCILSHLDHVYPELKDDEERINIWTQPIHLSNVHKLRLQLNDQNDPHKINELLTQSNPSVVTNVLKLYFMELPDSIIPHNFYDVIKLLYSKYQDDSQRESRINGLRNVLAETPKCNLATLDALLTHLKRLVQIIGSKDKEAARNLQQGLCNEFGKLVLRPRITTDLYSDHSSQRQYLNDKHPVNIMQDLFRYKDSIFNELKRKSSRHIQNGSGGSSKGVTRESSTTAAAASSSSSNVSVATSSEELAAKYKSRLESRLKQVVQKKDQIASTTPSPTNEVLVKSRKGVEKDEEKEKEKEEDEEDEQNINNRTLETSPTTPPASSSSSSLSAAVVESHNLLKRSSSPKKKRFSSMLLDNEVDKSETTLDPEKGR
ncbi:rga8 [Candida oxycetoniae]|uniref:Rga8 n=1 Tax=Candida oxycetoniae TaxID=497107 RepID=A0AAI9SYX0_9ASCO|nr:rga8 [Candida oxycetoniae]KAI3405218.2 rga8 [Candida oxycetoniae]